ncbi:MAG: ABC transporter ATP-binding protein [Planctomycetota bacterium]|nr:MAG: ABC transporter ATP-binding protein [Planctomycetota bacterium]
MALAARRVTAGYGNAPPVLQDVDLALERGRFLCLLGPNGTGKSTLLRVLAGLVACRSGSVDLDGADVARLGAQARARRVGFLPQEVQPAFSFRVDEAVALGARVAGHGRWFESRLSAEARAAVGRALESVGATELAERGLDTLSGGERRRVLVASVLAQEPDYLLLDEPAAMLDLHHQAGLFRTLQSLARRGLGVLCVTHDFNLAASFADELVLLHAGRVAARGGAREVLDERHLRPLFGAHFELISRPGAAPAVLPR